MKRHTAQWVRKAESDYAVAKKIARGSDPHHDEVSFHSQQCAEKYLKALLVELGQHVPYTHILEDLVAILVPYHSSLRSFRKGARFLTRVAVACDSVPVPMVAVLSGRDVLTASDLAPDTEVSLWWQPSDAVLLDESEPEKGERT